MSSKKFEKYLQRGFETDKTRTSYRTSLKEFFKQQKINNIDNWTKKEEEMDRKQLLKYHNKIKEQIKDHHYYLRHERKPPLLASNKFIYAIKHYLLYYEIELKECFWKKQTKNGNGNNYSTIFKTPTKKQLKDILEFGNIQSKTMFLLQATTGSRISEILSIDKDKDIDLNYKYPRILIRSSKAKKTIKRRTTPEVKELILNYLNERDRYLQTRINRSIRGKLKKTDNRLFPMSHVNAEHIWKEMIKKAGMYELDPITKKPVMGTHSLRRFFKVNFKDPYYAKYLMGQSTKTDRAYDILPEEQLDQLYEEHSKKLFFFSVDEETQEQIKNQTNLINQIKEENIELKKQNEDLKNQMNRIEQEVKQSIELKMKFEEEERLKEKIKKEIIEEMTGLDVKKIKKEMVDNNG